MSDQSNKDQTKGVPTPAVNQAGVEKPSKDTQPQGTNENTQDDSFLQSLDTKYPLSGGEQDEDL